ncbi:hypothetical protein M8A51_18200 [Schlegelella sp. S2-27]|uniref:Uncharacterized protein n=1 Tax=Caldimonas mangrovi TaxID=2944811 RepID=A0ABT0YSS2_9BURK|nr:hypothetical protein [Caldimonas mangrovi]MCM5681464.1 hypothetical protein [Caldimonas mangrovi]
MSIKFGRPIEPASIKGTPGTQQQGGPTAGVQPPDATGSTHAGDGPPLPRRHAGLSGARSHRMQATASAVLHPETVAAEICGQAISGRLPIAGCYSSKALASAAGVASNGVAALLGKT